MKISVIVPVYNVAPYLAICLNSLLPALAPGDELLLVQGASTDKSKEISLQYKAEHTQVMVLEQNPTLKILWFCVDRTCCCRIPVRVPLEFGIIV